VREGIRAVDQHAFVTDIRSMDQLIAGSQAERRAGTILSSVFGAMALVLAGVYRVITHAVVRRRLELAIRSALGAGRRGVVALAMRTALQPAAAGIALGAVAALGVTRVMTSLLFEVSALHRDVGPRHVPLFSPPVSWRDTYLGDAPLGSTRWRR